MNYRDLKNDISTQIDGKISIPIIGLWINRIILDIISRSIFDFNIREKLNGLLVASQEAYDLSTTFLDANDFNREILVKHTGVVDYEPYYLFAQRSRTVTGDIIYRYTIKGKQGTPGVMQILVNPLPTATAVATSLAIIYSKKPVEMSADTDEPEVPDNFHYVIVDGVLSRCWKALGQENFYVISKTDYEKGIADLIASESNRGRAMFSPKP